MPAATLTVEQYRKLTAKRHKYGAAAKEDRTVEIPGSMWAGVTLDSKREMQVALELEMLLKGGVYKRVDRQVRWPLVVNGVAICVYVCDFRVVHPDGSMECLEVKGVSTPVWRLKERLFRALWPKVSLRILR